MSKRGEWLEMAKLVSDEMLDAIGVSGTPAEVGRKLRARNAGCESTSLVLYNETEADALADLIRSFREG
jgi:hypothetical protein